MAETETGIVLPPGVDAPAAPAMDLPAGRGMIVNETDLPDESVAAAVETFFEEHASVLGANQGNTFQTYANQQQGSLLARSKFRTPGNVLEEIVLARDMAERDDDVAAAMGMMLALAFEGGMAHSHQDDVTVALFDEVARNADLDSTFAELYREWLISGQITTANVWTREPFQFTPEGADRQRTRRISAPLIGVLPAEQIRVIDSDLFRTGTLAYRPSGGRQEEWLKEFFDPKTSAGRKAAMRQEDPVLAQLVVEELEINDPFGRSYIGEEGDPLLEQRLYRLNPRLVHRTTMAKGAWKYPRPPMTRNFALLEAKRLLNLMDYALLQGGSNFLVVAKKGSDDRPALPQEVANLRDTLRRATRTGVVVGDHRLNIEIITPDLTELLSPSKRKLLGRKLANGLLRLPDFGDDDPGTEGMKAALEMVPRIISWDRRQLRRHVENRIYPEVVKRNERDFPTGAASIWFPRIVLQGLQYFTDLVLKLRDRGDISRRSAVAAGGFDYRAEVEARKREKPDDRVMVPAQVPFSSPNAGPQDNQNGRPRGSGPNNGAPGASPGPGRDPAAPRPLISRVAGETVRAMYDEDAGTFRCGERTYDVLEQFPDHREGRLTALEQRAIAFIESGEWPGPMREGPVTVVPVNGEYAMTDHKAIRLAGGLSMILGYRVEDDAMVARAFCFREPEFQGLDGEERALGWGFPTQAVAELESGD